MTTVTLTLPEDLVEKAKAKDLLSSSSVESLLREKLEEDEYYTEEEVDELLKGLVNPKIYRKGKILGDIISPLYVEVGENQ